MKNLIFLFICASFFIIPVLAQESPCSPDNLIARMKSEHSNILDELNENEIFTAQFISRLKNSDQNAMFSNAEYIIPVVLHIFHDGEDGKIDMEQIQSGLEILNKDFKGENEDWLETDPVFELVKSKLNIRFCLATIDPNGEPTMGINYYNDPEGLNNNGNIRRVAWDNYKYLNIYLPKYAFGGPTDFTAYAYLPSTTNSDANGDGIVYSSIRWGYGSKSELDEGQEWASVITHEAGHWLNLQHTFSAACGGAGDFVSDTPPSLGGDIFLEGCLNNDFSCGVHTNGENYMDYNHDCKKMFTKGQVERMIAALNLPSRSPIWTEENLKATGCYQEMVNTSSASLEKSIIYPNPSDGIVHFDLDRSYQTLSIYDAFGYRVETIVSPEMNCKIDFSTKQNGIYFYTLRSNEFIASGKFSIIN